MTAAEPAIAVGADFTWGVTTPPGFAAAGRRQIAATTYRRTINLLGSAAVALAAFLGIAGVGMSSTSPAHADIFGISDAVQDWLCGVVAPEEPWEGVGDGPEAWLSNHNLAKVSEAPVVQVSGDGTATTVPGRPGVPDTVDQLRALPKGQYTLYEVAGLRGLSWWTMPINADKTRNCSLWNYVWTQGGNLLFTLNKNLLQVIISLKEEAATPQPLAFLYDASGEVMGNLFTFGFIPIAMLTLLVSAIWVGVMSARGKANIRGTFSLMAAAFAIAALMAFMYTLTGGKAGFRQVAEGADSTISFLNATGTNAILDGLTANQGSCGLDKTGDQVERGQRVTSCVLADALAYRPWEIGQFGSAGAKPIPLPAGWSAQMPDAAGKLDVAAVLAGHQLPCWVNFGSCSDLRTYLIAQHGGVQLDGKPSGSQGYTICKTLGIRVAVAAVSSPDDLKSAIDSTANCSPMYGVFTALAQSDPATAAIYAGQGSVTRVSLGFTSLLSILLVGVAVAVTSVISMGWEAITFAHFLIGPIKNAFALYAGKMKLTKEWLEDLGYSYVMRLAYGFVLAIMIVIIVWMMNSTQSFGMRLFWLAVILIGFWKIVQKVQGLLRPGRASMAPDMARHVTAGAEKAGRFAGSHAVRAAPGGVKSMKATRERRRMLANDPTRGPMRRRIGALTAPLSYLTSGARGAVTGSSAAAEARVAKANSRAMLRAVSGGPAGKGSPPDQGARPRNGPQPQTPGTQDQPTARRAGEPNPNAVKAKDAPSSIRVATPRRRVTPPPAAASPAQPAPATAGTSDDRPRPDPASPSPTPSPTPPSASPPPAPPAPTPDDAPAATAAESSAADNTPQVEPDTAGHSGSDPRPRVIRPILAPASARRRMPGLTPGVQRPRMRVGGSPLGLANQTRRPAAGGQPAATAPADKQPTTNSSETATPAPSRPPETAGEPASPPRPRAAGPAAPAQSGAAAASSTSGQQRSVDPAAPAPSSASRPAATKSRAGKGNSETQAITRQTKAKPGKGDAPLRPPTTPRSAP